jgi:cytochrome P450
VLGVQLSDAYEDPETFRPERFLDQPVPSYALIPFGGGTHRCIGASFAMMEMKAVLSEMLDAVELLPVNDKPERAVRWRNITVMPSRGARAIVRPRDLLPA